MKLPAFGSNRRVTATLPALTGGVQRQQGIAHVADNALWEGENLWWQQGALRPRPGFFTAERRAAYVGQTASLRWCTDGNERLVALALTDGKLRLYVYTPDTQTTSLFVLDETADTLGYAVPAGGSRAAFDTLLVFAGERIWGVNVETRATVELTGAVHIPLRLTEATPARQKSETFWSGIFPESANRLTPWFYSEFRSDGEGIYYRLPCGGITGGVSVTWSSGEAGYALEIPADATSAETEDGIRVQLDRRGGWLWFQEGGSNQVLPAADACNLWVYAATASCDKQAVFSATSACWFGGKRSGVAGGTRLFLANGSRLLWSALENALYFPVENEAAVGLPTQAITALHRQADRLVIFKERELYSAEYEAVTGSDLPAETAAFPLTPLHGEIGCDLPDTVALRGSRLTWACRDGTVYTLSAFGSLTQPSVTRLSAAVEPLLRENGPPATAAGALWDGRYWLLWDRQLLVLEGESDPVWHTFTVPDTGAVLQTVRGVGSTLLIPALLRHSGGLSLLWYTPEGEQDCHVTAGETGLQVTRRPIPTRLCTKAYDMGEPDTYKQVLGVVAELAAHGAVQATYLTERGERLDCPAVPGADGLLRLSPALTRCRRFALRLTGDNLILESLAIHFKGGLR